MIKLFRLVSLLEGLSYLILAFCSYLKHFHGIEDAVKIPGMTHGLLFVSFVLLLVNCWISKGWKAKFGIAAFFSAIIPFGFLWLDAQLKKKS